VEAGVVSELVAYCRLRALLSGTAVRLSATRNVPISELPLVCIPVQMAGEAPALFAIGIGDLAGNLEIFTCPHPTSHQYQYGLLADVAYKIGETIEQWNANPHLMPQIVAQSAAATTLMLAVIDRMAYIVDPKEPHLERIRAVGRSLAYFDRRFERPDSAANLAATTTVTEHYATGQDPHADQHLGALVEWLKDPDSNVRARVREAEQLPVSVSTDPGRDNEHLVPMVEQFVAAERAGNKDLAKMIRERIHAELVPEVTRRYQLVLEAMRAVTAVPETAYARMVAGNDRRAFDEFQAYVANNPGLPRGFHGTTGHVEFIFRELAQRQAESSALQAQGRYRAEARLNGEVLHGRVIDRRCRRAGLARLIDYDVRTDQDRLRIREGEEIELMDHPGNFVFRVEHLERDGPGTRITLRMVAGMTKPDQPAVGQLIEFRPKPYFSRRGQHARDRIVNAGMHPQVAGPGAGGTDFLAVVAAMEKK
jgi:hypothetical protein